jgi:hypothetical protein
MNANRIREALATRPFEPFDVRLVDGRSFTIPHPDYLTLPPSPRPRDLSIYTLKPDDPDDYRIHRIDLALVLELTIPAESAARPGSAQGNGA